MRAIFPRSLWSLPSAFGLGALLLGVGCQTPNNGDLGTSTTDQQQQTQQRQGQQRQGQQQAGDLAPDEIVGVVDAIHLGEIEQARYMLRPEVRGDLSQGVADFATRMVEEHTQARVDLARMMADAEIGADESVLQTQVIAETNAVLANMRATDALPLFELEQSYIEGQVMLHERAIEIIDNRLMKSATQPEMQTRLEETRSMIQEHLDEAKQVRKMLEDREPVAAR